MNQLCGLPLALLMVCASARPAVPAADLVIADFETSDYGRWNGTGTAFRRGPCDGCAVGREPEPFEAVLVRYGARFGVRYGKSFP
jgi:hypothetical protein